MAPNNALGQPTAAAMRAKAEGKESPANVESRPSSSPARKVPYRRKVSGGGHEKVDMRSSTADGFGAGGGAVSKEEVASRGTGSAVRTPLEEFEARPRDELRCFWTAVMFLTRLPCPGWCVPMPCLEPRHPSPLGADAPLGTSAQV